MPLTALFLKDTEDNKKGDRVRMPVSQFVPLFRKKIVKRVGSFPVSAAHVKTRKPRKKNAAD